jgi:hypothetical protein
MRTLFAAVYLLLGGVVLFAQAENYEFDNFTVTVQKNILSVKSVSGETIYTRQFDNLKEFTSDLDGDSIPEFCVSEEMKNGNNTIYKMLVYNTVDTFTLADSLESLNMEPYSVADEDSGQLVFVAADTNFLRFAGDVPVTAAVNCYEFDGLNFVQINDQIYDIFMRQNEEIVDSLDNFFDDNSNDCASSKKVLSLIASLYVNYKNADENSISLHLLNKYYFCSDLLDFKSKLDGLLKVEKNEDKLE